MPVEEDSRGGCDFDYDIGESLGAGDDAGDAYEAGALVDAEEQL